MAVLRRRFARARRLARKMLWECGFDEPSKIDPFVLAGRLGIQVICGRIDGATGRIFRHGDRAIIRVSDAIVQHGRVRFTVAHEVAHFLLGHRIPGETNLEASAGAPFSVHQEREADAFASELLMPEEWVVPLCADATPNLSAVRAIAVMFRVSIVAAAVRHVELTREPCALVYSEQGSVVWARSSATFPARIPNRGFKIGPGAIAFAYNRGNLLDDSSRIVPAAAWLGAVPQRHGLGRASMLEHAAVIPEPGWGGVLSVLSIKHT